MPRDRSVSVEDVPVDVTTNPLRMKYVSHKLKDCSGVAGFLMQEVIFIRDHAKFTRWQQVCWELNLCGYTVREIAKGFGKSPSMIQQHLDSAQRKACGVKIPGYLRGMYTVLVEECENVDLVREVLADVLDLNTKPHPLAKKYTRRRYEKEQRKAIARWGEP